ncbi:hypothetical protein AMECASPLE_025231 [Ameca splendens]|uniref:Ig-like domain-containing protein n=1 Tax=Ameca splendens TaxID=208324 RepID=A0ABV0XHI4_9TELE
MTPAHFVFRLTCLLLVNMAQADQHVSPAVRQKSGLMSVKAGDTLTLECFYDPDVVAKFNWYKLTLGQKPKLISTVFKYETNVTFHNEFKNNSRFSLDSKKEEGKNHLIITELQLSDTATYYCSSSYLYLLEFGDGTTVIVEGSGSNIQTLVHQSESETIQLGGSVTLTCTVQIGSCDGEHNVYWFRNSEESFAGLLYTQRGRNNNCGKGLQEQTFSCLYNLPLKNPNVSHAGTYYCAVALCGHIVFGNGTKLGIPGGVTSVYLLRGALAFTSFLSFLQAFLLFRIYKRKSPNNSESRSGFSHSGTATTEGDQDEENLQYTGLRLQKVYTSTRQRNETANCVYSSIKN